MDTLNKTASLPEEEAPKKFKGYTLEELRYQRAIVALKREFAKSKTLSGASKLKKHNPFSSDGGKLALSGKVGGIASRIFTGLNYMDYIMLGFSLFKSGRKIFSFFRKK